MPFVPQGDDPVWHLFVIEIDKELLGFDRNEILGKLKKKGIGTSVHFIPVHLQPFYKSKYKLKPQDFPISLEVYRRIISLPLYTKMSEADVKFVTDFLKRLAGQ